MGLQGLKRVLPVLTIIIIFGLLILLYDSDLLTNNRRAYMSVMEAGMGQNKMTDAMGNESEMTEAMRDEFKRMKPVDAWNHLKQHTKDADSVFYNFNPIHELETSINSSFFHPLPGYKNPCWIVSINDSNVYGHHDSIKVQQAWDEMQQIFTNRIARGKHWRVRCFPYTLLIGMSKSGTSNLFKKINEHPEIFPSAKKETWFWGRFRMGREKRVEEIPANLTHYMNFFDKAAESIRLLTESDETGVFHPGITMEGTPHYLWDHGAWDLVPGNAGLDEPRFLLPHTLYALVPNLKLIVILRKPTDRQYSMFRMINDDATPAKFHENVELSLKLWKECRQLKSERGCTYDHEQNNKIQSKDERFGLQNVVRIRSGVYHIMIQDWLKVFPRSQILILRAEDYYSDMAGTLRKVFRYLGVKELSEADMEILLPPTERSSRTEPMYPKTRKLLDDIYKPTNIKLAELLGDPAFSWS